MLSGKRADAVSGSPGLNIDRNSGTAVIGGK
jgi:hypothetical protein